MRTLQSRLGAHDRAKVSDYLDDVREIERRIQQSEAQQRTDVTLMDKPLGVPESFEEHSALMFDLLAMAWQTDLSRVFTFMMSRELSQRTFPQLGVTDPWHVVSHHGDRPEKLANNAKVNVLCLQMFARLPREAEEHARTATGRCCHIRWCSTAAAWQTPTSTPPTRCRWWWSAARRGRGDRHLQLAPKTQIGNLWLTVANQFGGSMRQRSARAPARSACSEGGEDQCSFHGCRCRGGRSFAAQGPRWRCRFSTRWCRRWVALAHMPAQRDHARGVHLRPARRRHGVVDAGHRRRARSVADTEDARAGQGVADRHHQPAAGRADSSRCTPRRPAVG